MNGAFRADRDDRASAGWSALLARALDACAKAPTPPAYPPASSPAPG